MSGLSFQRLSQSNPEHCLLAAAIALGPFREHRDYSLGLAILWLSWHLLRQIWSSRHHLKGHIASLTPGIALGLLLIQSRMLMRMDDNEGPIRYFLIAVALLVGSSLSLANWKHLLGWISKGTLVLSILLLLLWDPTINLWLNHVNKTLLGEGYGGVNMLGSVLNVLFICSFYSLRLNNNLCNRLISGAACLFSYTLCLASHSRMAALAPLLAAFFAWIVSEGWPAAKVLPRRLKAVAIGAFITLPTSIYWHFAIRPDFANGMNSDRLRLNIMWCHLQNSIFAGNNKIAYGSGYDANQLRDACGHASSHNAYVQLLSMHGVLGVIALGVILILVIQGIINHLCHRDSPQGIWSCSWAEAALGCTFVVMITAISSSTHLGGYLNPLLIGLMLSMGLISLPEKCAPQNSGQSNVRITSY